MSSRSLVNHFVRNHQYLWKNCIKLIFLGCPENFTIGLWAPSSGHELINLDYLLDWFWWGLRLFSGEVWGCFLMSGVRMLHFFKDWWNSFKSTNTILWLLQWIQPFTWHSCIHSNILYCDIFEKFAKTERKKKLWSTAFTANCDHTSKSHHCCYFCFQKEKNAAIKTCVSMCRRFCHLFVPHTPLTEIWECGSKSVNCSVKSWV